MKIKTAAKMKTVAALLMFSFGIHSALAQQVDKKEENITITKNGSVETIKGPGTTFSGDVDVVFSIPRRDNSNISGGLVTFSPKARSNWHTHPHGQLLIVTAGEGRVQEWGKQQNTIYPGDLVWIDAGVKHWHGAAPDAAMTHYSIQEEDGKAADWMEKVTDEQYNQ